MIKYIEENYKIVLFEEYKTDYIPNINEKITISVNDAIYKGFVIDKIVYKYKNYTTDIEIYIKVTEQYGTSKSSCSLPK